jgi:2-keto-4-pentenoate hydratase
LAQPGNVALARRGGHALDDPAWLLPAWLRHVSRTGLTVPAGTVVSTGAWGGMQALSKASLAGVPIDLSFEGLGCYRFSLDGQ